MSRAACVRVPASAPPRDRCGKVIRGQLGLRPRASEKSRGCPGKTNRNVLRAPELQAEGSCCDPFARPRLQVAEQVIGGRGERERLRMTEEKVEEPGPQRRTAREVALFEEAEGAGQDLSGGNGIGCQGVLDELVAAPRRESPGTGSATPLRSEHDSPRVAVAAWTIDEQACRTAWLEQCREVPDACRLALSGAALDAKRLARAVGQLIEHGIDCDRFGPRLGDHAGADLGSGGRHDGECKPETAHRKGDRTLPFRSP
jgi:hypothetical protein